VAQAFRPAFKAFENSGALAPEVQKEMPDKPYLIAIAGPSGAGKTTVARRLAAALPATIFSLDSYYFDLSHLPFDERARNNFDHPDSLDSELLSRHLHQLAEGKEILRPIYDFASYTRSSETERVNAGAYLIVEGLFALYWESIRSIIGTKIFVDAAHDVCLPRRQARDIQERGYTADGVLDRYSQTVRPMADQYIIPTRQYADIVLDGCKATEQSAASVLAHIKQHRQSGDRV
jgi:uridine kinase